MAKTGLLTKKSKSSSLTEIISLLGILWLAFALRVILLSQAPLLVDELYESKHHIGQSILYNLTNFRVDAHLLHVLATMPMASVGWQPFLLRWASLLIGILSVALVYKLGRQLFKFRVAWLGAALFAVLPAAVLTSIEIRGYALMILLSLLSNIALLQALQHSKIRYWLLFALTGALAMAAHLFSALFFVPAFLFIAGWLMYHPVHRRVGLWGTFWALIIIGLGTTFLLGLMLQSRATIANFEQVWTDHLDSEFTAFIPSDLLQTFTPYLEPIRRANFTTEINWSLLLYGGVILLGVITGLTQKQQRWKIGYLLLVAFAPLLSVTIIHSIVGPSFRAFDRYFDFALFTYIFLAVYGVWWLGDTIGRSYRWLQVVVVALLVGLLVSPAYQALTVLLEQGQTQQLMTAAQYLRQRITPNDLILCVARDNEPTKLIRDRCLLSLNFEPELTGQSVSWQELNDFRIWQNLILPERSCIFNYEHVPHVRLNPACTDGLPNKTHIWLIFWQQGDLKTPYTWDSPLLEAQFGQTRLLHLTESNHLADNLQTAAALIMADKVPPARAIQNTLTLAHLGMGIGDLAQANKAIDLLNGGNQAVLAEADKLRRQLPYLSGPAQPETRLQATWGQQIQLQGYSLQSQPLSPETYNLSVTLFWEAAKVPEKDYTFFLHWRDANNANISQIDFRPFDGLWPTSHWLPGQILRETRTLQIPSQAQNSGKLVVGIYDVQTMERLSLENDTSQENVLILQ